MLICRNHKYCSMHKSSATEHSSHKGFMSWSINKGHLSLEFSFCTTIRAFFLNGKISLTFRAKIDACISIADSYRNTSFELLTMCINPPARKRLYQTRFPSVDMPYKPYVYACLYCFTFNFFHHHTHTLRALLIQIICFLPAFPLFSLRHLRFFHLLLLS